MLQKQFRLRKAVRGRNWVLPTILVLSISAFAQAQAVAELESQIEKEIHIKAEQLQLGKQLSQIHRSEGARSRGWGLPRTVAWWQEFAGGRVYWMALSRARGVRGDILTRWVALGGEQGEQGFGFPVSDEEPCEAQGGRFQIFEFGAIYWRASTREITVHPFQSPGDYFSRPGCSAVAPGPTPVAKDEVGRFRVILTGFTVNRQTDDHILESDGKGDEVFIVTEVAQYDLKSYDYARDRERHPEPTLHGGRPQTLRRTLTSILMGDANNQEAPRIAAGTATNNGGLRTGDTFPTKEPWNLTGTPSANRLPMIAWEGELRYGMVIIVPTIWEWDDGNVRARQQFVHNIDAHFNIGTYLHEGLWAGGVAASDIAGAGDRPIAGLGNPSSIRLDFQTAAAAAEKSVKHGPGVYEIHYQGTTEDYTLYYKIERVR